MFVFAHPTLPTAYPDTLNVPLSEINLFCHIVADIGWHFSLSRVPAA